MSVSFDTQHLDSPQKCGRPVGGCLYGIPASWGGTRPSTRNRWLLPAVIENPPRRCSSHHRPGRVANRRLRGGGGDGRAVVTVVVAAGLAGGAGPYCDQQMAQRVAGLGAIPLLCPPGTPPELHGNLALRGDDLSSCQGEKGGNSDGPLRGKSARLSRVERGLFSVTWGMPFQRSGEVYVNTFCRAARSLTYDVSYTHFNLRIVATVRGEPKDLSVAV